MTGRERFIKPRKDRLQLLGHRSGEIKHDLNEFKHLREQETYEPWAVAVLYFIACLCVVRKLRKTLIAVGGQSRNHHNTAQKTSENCHKLGEI